MFFRLSDARWRCNFWSHFECHATTGIEWQPLWSWFRRKVTSSLNVIFRGRLFVPSTSDPSNPVSFSPWRHHRTVTPRDFTKQSASPWNYWTFGTFRSFSLGCITRRKGIKKASCCDVCHSTRLLVLLCFSGCQTLGGNVTFDHILSVKRQMCFIRTLPLPGAWGCNRTGRGWCLRPRS